MLYFWLMRSEHDLTVFYNFLERIIKKENTYKIYKLNPICISNQMKNNGIKYTKNLQEEK